MVLFYFHVPTDTGMVVISHCNVFLLWIGISRDASSVVLYTRIINTPVRLNNIPEKNTCLDFRVGEEDINWFALAVRRISKTICSLFMWWEFNVLFLVIPSVHNLRDRDVSNAVSVKSYANNKLDSFILNVQVIAQTVERYTFIRNTT